MLKDLKVGDLVTGVGEYLIRGRRPYFVVTSPPVYQGSSRQLYLFSCRCVEEDGETDFYKGQGWGTTIMMTWPVERFQKVSQGDPWDAD